MKSNVYVFIFYQCFLVYLVYEISVHIVLFDVITFNWILFMAYHFNYVLFRLKYLNGRMAELNEVEIKREIGETIEEHVAAIEWVDRLILSIQHWIWFNFQFDEKVQCRP